MKTESSQILVSRHVKNRIKRGPNYVKGTGGKGNHEKYNYIVPNDEGYIPPEPIDRSTEKGWVKIGKGIAKTVQHKGSE